MMSQRTLTHRRLQAGDVYGVQAGQSSRHTLSSLRYWRWRDLQHLTLCMRASPWAECLTHGIVTLLVYVLFEKITRCNKQNVAGARRAMKLPTDRTAVASIKEVNTGPKSKNLSDSIILELLD